MERDADLDESEVDAAIHTLESQLVRESFGDISVFFIVPFQYLLRNHLT